MKLSLLILALASIFLVSCSSNDYTIVGKGFDTDSVKYDYTKIDPVTHKSTVISYPLYKVRANFDEKYLLAKHLHTVWMCWTLIALGIGFLVYGSILGVKSSGSYVFVFVLMLGIAVIAGGLQTVSWSASKEADIPVPTYNAQMAKYGNLHHWWVDLGNLYKSKTY
jgi:hypothetical protein